jgi:hypothetical protein
MLLYSSTGHSRLWQALCRSPLHSKGYLRNHTHWYAYSADLDWPREKQEASTDKGSVCWQRVQLCCTPRWFLAYSGGMNEGDGLPIRNCGRCPAELHKSSPAEPQNAAQTQPKHTYKRQTSLSSRAPPATKQARKTVNTTSSSPNAATLGTGDRRSMSAKGSRSLDVCGMTAGQAHSPVRIATDRHKAQTSMEQATKYNTTTERLSCKLTTILLLSSTAVNSTLQLLRACRPAGSSPVYYQSKSTKHHNCRVVRITRRRQHCSSFLTRQRAAGSTKLPLHTSRVGLNQPPMVGLQHASIVRLVLLCFQNLQPTRWCHTINCCGFARTSDRNRIQMPIVQCRAVVPAVSQPPAILRPANHKTHPNTTTKQ